MDKICKFTRWKQFLLIGMLCNGLLAFLLQAVSFAINKRGISVALSLCLEAVGAILALLFWAFAFVSYRKQFESAKPMKDFVIGWWSDSVALMVGAVLFSTVPTLLFQYLGFLTPIAAFIGGGISLLALFVICLLLLSDLALDLQVRDAFISKKVLRKQVGRKPLFLLATAGVFLWFIIGQGAVDFLFLLLSASVGNSLMAQCMDKLVLAACHTFVIVWYLEYAGKMYALIAGASTPAVKEAEEVGTAEAADEMPEQSGTETESVEVATEMEPEKDETKKATSKHGKLITLSIITAAAVVFAVVTSVYQTREYEQIKVDEYIAQMMDDAATEIEFERVDEGIRIYAEVEEYLEALDAYINEDNVSVADYMEQNSEDDFYRRLYYTMTDDVDMVAELLLESQVDTRLCHDILRYYKEEGIDEDDDEEDDEERENDDDEDKAEFDAEELIDDCMWICMSQGAFVDSTIKFDKDSLRKRSVNNMKEEYEEQLMHNELLTLLQNTSLNGHLDEQTVYRLLDLADKNPENMAYQMLAVMGGSQYLHDKAGHYGRVITCAKRLNDLLVEESRDVSELVEQKLYLAEMVMDCNDYQTALGFLEDVRLEGNTDVEDNVLTCYYELNDNEAIVEYVEDLRKDGVDRAFLDYMAALANLRVRNVDATLENGVLLAEKVIAEEETREENNALLFSLVEYLCIGDSYYDYIDYYHYVRNYTEEQLAIMKQAPLMESYINAANAIYNSGNKEAALSALEIAEQEAPGLSLTWFMKGTMYFNHKMYDEAIDAFRRCIAVDETNTTAIYSLAVLYDIKGDYETSAMFCKQVLEATPTSNHAKDWYGVSIHTQRLYDALQKYVGGAN